MRRSFLAGLMALVLSVTVARAQDTAPPAAHTLMHATVAAVAIDAGGHATATVHLTLATGWHVYSVDWSPEEFLFKVDGETSYQVSRAMIEKYGRYAYDNPKFVILNLALGGNYPMSVNGEKGPPHAGLPAAAAVQREQCRCCSHHRNRHRLKGWPVRDLRPNPLHRIIRWNPSRSVPDPQLDDRHRRQLDRTAGSL